MIDSPRFNVRTGISLAPTDSVNVTGHTLTTNPRSRETAGVKVWQRANYESFAGKMLRRRNLDDTSICRNDDNPLRPTTR